MLARLSSLSVGAVLAASLLTACSSSDDSTLSQCADPSVVPVFPSPAWHEGPNLSPPVGDRAASVIEEARAGWLAQMPELDGWPRLPEIVVPLSVAATDVDANAVSLFTEDDDGWSRVADATFDVRIESDPPSLIVRPQVPFEPGATEVVIGFGSGMAAGAQTLPACGADGGPHPDYEAAASALPGDAGVELALRIKLARASELLPALGQALAKAPVLVVASIEGRTLASFGDAAPPAAAQAVLAPTAASGILALPDYRGSASAFALDSDGLPVAAGTTRPGFIVALPSSGTAPYPFVLFQHGGGQNKVDLFKLAEPLAAAGFAIVGIDLPVHGDRAPDGGGGDLDFLKFDDPLATRENFRQAVADHLAVLTGVQALNEALEPILGTSSALDPDRSFYMGLSLGGISGSITFASAPAANLRAGALFVAGAGYSELVNQGLFKVLFGDVAQLPPADAAVVFGALGALLDGADPAAYGRHAEDREAPPRPAIFMQAIADPIIGSSTNERLARAYGAALVLPKDHDAAGMEELELPTSDNFSWNASGAKATRVLVHNPMAEVAESERHGTLLGQDYSQQMVAHCFTTLLATGSCEIIDTQFSSR